MSDFGEIENAVLAHVAAEVPGITTERGFRPLDDVKTFPFAYTLAPAENATKLEAGQQETRTVVTSYVIVEQYPAELTAAARVEAMGLVIDGVRDRVRADPDLGGVVERAHVSLREIDDRVGGSRVAGLLEVTSEVTE